MDLETALDARALVPRRNRLLVLVIALVCVAGTGTLGVLFARDRVGSAFDQEVYWLVYQGFVGEPGLLDAMLVPTEPVFLVIVVALVVMLAVARHRPRVAVLAVAGPGTAVLLNGLLLKPVFGRTINETVSAYPSGHTAGMVAVLTVLTLAAAPGGPGPRRRSPVLVVLAVDLLVFAVAATALVGHKYHYVTDTFGGLGTGVSAVLGVAVLVDRVAARRVRVAAVRKHSITSGVAL